MIKLLGEGFDLHEHLLALRRYHFMELADWADLFIMSLWHRVFLSNQLFALWSFINWFIWLQFLLIHLVFFVSSCRSGVLQKLIIKYQKFKGYSNCQFRGLHVNETIIRTGYLFILKKMEPHLFQHLLQVISLTVIASFVYSFSSSLIIFCLSMASLAHFHVS